MHGFRGNRHLPATCLLFKEPQKRGRTMKLNNWLGNRQANTIAEGEVKQLTDQFYVTLRAYSAGMQAVDRKLTPEALQRLQDLLNPERPRSWSEAYEIEQMLTHLFENETLKTE